jgi:hypothetical protein
LGTVAEEKSSKITGIRGRMLMVVATEVYHKSRGWAPMVLRLEGA